MTSTTTIRPSDVVRWDVSRTAARWSLRKLGTGTTFLDHAPERYGSDAVRNPSWSAVIRCERPVRFAATVEYPEDARVWTLYTEGDAGSGGRRYRHRLTLTEAQTIALAWLDRRFSIEDLDD